MGEERDLRIIIPSWMSEICTIMLLKLHDRVMTS